MQQACAQHWVAVAALFRFGLKAVFAQEAEVEVVLRAAGFRETVTFQKLEDVGIVQQVIPGCYRLTSEAKAWGSWQASMEAVNNHAD